MWRILNGESAWVEVDWLDSAESASSATASAASAALKPITMTGNRNDYTDPDFATIS